MAMPLSSKDEELQWVMHVRHLLEQDIREDEGLTVSIVKVPKMLASVRPEAYIPHLVALGPYHHHQSDLQEMERYKLLAAKRLQKQIGFHKFQNLVNDFMQQEHQIRAHYHRYLDLKCETLAWMLVMDAAFLLEFLTVYEGYVDGMKGLSSRIVHMLDYSRSKTAHNMILKDVLMVENQIPLFLLHKIMEVQSPSLQEASDNFVAILLGFINEVYPLKGLDNPQCIFPSEYPHLLDLLYREIVPKSCSHSVCIGSDYYQDEERHLAVASPQQSSCCIELCVDRTERNCQTRKGCIFRYFKRAFFSVALKIISTLPVFVLLKQPLEHLFSSNEEANAETECPNQNADKIRPPLVEEITIPSVTELVKSGVTFLPTNSGISSINFDEKACTFHLPTICLDVNTETIIRNLVAYEVSVTNGNWILTRYTELMNGIIDTAMDVRLLREAGILLNCMKSDEEAAELWNGMSRSIRLTSVPTLDRVVEDVNLYYNRKWRNKIKSLMRRNGFDMQALFACFSVAMVLFLITIHSYCLFHRCAR